MDNESFGVAHPLSLKIPALLIRMVTVPNASMAVLMTAEPSETEEVFTTAFPPAKNSGFRDSRKMQTCAMINL